MIERRPGESPTIECRADADASVERRKRYRQILTCLREMGPSTAKEIAVSMMRHGYAPSDDRNLAAPRLTELGRRGVVEPVGKKRCAYTGKTVTVWGLCNG
jgi:hypothetical protein